MASTSPEGRIDKAVADYLAFHGLHQSLSTFLEELREVRPRNGSRQPGGKPSSRLAQDLLGAFDAGEEQTFFRLWSTYVPIGPAGSGDDGSDLGRAATRLSFYCHVHFAVHPYRRFRGQGTPPGAESHMRALKEFLAGPGRHLAQTPEFM